MRQALRHLRRAWPLIVLIGWITASLHDSSRPWTPLSPLQPVTLVGQSNIQPYAYWVPPGNCNTTVSANSTGTQGLTVVGTSNTPVVTASTSATGLTNTHTYVCNLAPIAALTSIGTNIRIKDVVFFYGQQTALGTQVAVLASGTMNASTVFSLIQYPPPGASETATTVAPVRADSGTLVITPVVASFNTSTTTAGAFFSVDFRPATPIGWNTDLQQLLLTVTLQTSGDAATITNSPGALVHIRSN